MLGGWGIGRLGVLGGFEGIEGDGGAVGAAAAVAGELAALLAGEASLAVGGAWVGADDESEDAVELDPGSALGASPLLNAFAGAS